MTTQRQIDRLTAIRAAEWYELIRATPDEAPKEFMEWLESPAHMEAFMAIASDAPAMRDAFKSEHFNLDELLQKASSQVVSLEPLRLQPQARVKKDISRARRAHRPWLAIAAGLTLLVMGVSLYLHRGQTFETRVGEQRILQLTDGSVVRLNARSHLEVDMGNGEREIRLSGEALFKVAPDPRRPFRVYTDNATVQAVGTQFNVYEQQDGTTLVSVLEGKVQVTAPAPKGVMSLVRGSSESVSSNRLPLAAGQQARVGTAGVIEQSPAPDVKAATALQDRKLVFKHTGLEKMVDEFNRYNTMQLHLEGVSSEDFFYSGIFDADDPQALARLLEREPELTIRQRGNEIVVQGKTAGAALQRSE